MLKCVGVPEAVGEMAHALVVSHGHTQEECTELLLLLSPGDKITLVRLGFCFGHLGH